MSPVYCFPMPSYYKQLCIKLPNRSEANVVDKPTYVAAIEKNDHAVLQEIIQNVTQLPLLVKDVQDKAPAMPAASGSDYETSQGNAKALAMPAPICSDYETSQENDDATLAPLAQQDTSKVQKEEKFQWTHKRALLLIESYRCLKDKFDSSAIRKSQAWKMVAERMRAKGVDDATGNISEKWRSLKYRCHDRVPTEQ
ncbi:uncharacterized protein LOC119728965 [Patiria miniata]|uniref:Myb/SANT-like DNA-binding domain-containing protein n=1 Tax=Patiria miniata TaxID=46514 RepID=A0A914A131_PATMI|nr:uncharacterized protein LOC119728965 [Patiria miniata]XP_038057358.1 uncharacterized protein LOC119728965 [Patiria miniata]XP_038057359.1 uncharacterized protein LOC119728965 [Patiria miniata]